MKALTVLGAVVRLVALIVLAWLIVGFVSPTPDPFVISLALLLLIGIVLAIAPSRRALLGWLHFGR